MCGIIGYAGERSALPVLLGALQRLEYRGYDSSGVSLVGDDGLVRVRAVGNLAQLERALAGDTHDDARSGIGHTRWATHGRVCEANAHPLAGCREGELALVLNGIVENFVELRSELRRAGHAFRSETDAEVVAHLVEAHYDGDLVAAVRAASERLEGHFAFVVCHVDDPGHLVAMRRHCPLVVGRGDDGTYVSSAIAAFVTHTRRVQFLEDDEVVSVRGDEVRVFAPDGGEVERPEEHVDWVDDPGDKVGHETYMLKEIREQPATLEATLAEAEQALHDDRLFDEDELRGLRKVLILGCGTAYHAGVVGRYLVEEWARVPLEFDIASEWRYRNPLVEEDTLVVGISQSGETADTLAALRLARARGCRTLAITNVPGSQITREADRILFTRCGMEMGVAATKTFTAQVVALAVFALRLAEARGSLTPERLSRLRDQLHALPSLAREFLAGDHPIEEIARAHAEKPFFLYLGRHVGVPVCLEGALKLKEIAYVPTEAYSAGEMKHGPIALLDETTPVVVIATDSHVQDKLISNIQEVRARGAQVVAVATDGNEALQHHVEDVVYVPSTDPLLQPVLAALPLQLLAYEIARLRGLDVDRPRNLAKTVTVE
jgi:glucosamine--fructose-6-phosphate aminotransferase (isomerizing)